MKSALNVTETKVKTFQRKLEEAIQNLSDAETLLDRAIRIKEQQDKLLPLFQIISGESRPKECRLDLTLASIIILSTGTFDQKLSQLIQAYDPNHSGYFNIHFLIAIQYLFHETFYTLNYISFPPRRDEIVNNTQRILLTEYSNCFHPERLPQSSSTYTSPTLMAACSHIYLNQYELKQFLVNCLGMSRSLCQLVGVLTTEKYSTYQRNQMSALSLNRQNLISYSTTLYRTHFSLTQHRPLLNPEHVRKIHDLALNMGTVDPNRTNYQKFIKKVKKASDSEVVPVDTGHLMNVLVYQDRIRNQCALKIQTIIRAYLQRRKAEIEAKKQAFRQARKLALLEMKEKVLKEFKRREAFEGTAKMKWDAQVRSYYKFLVLIILKVRMRQAKLRSNGTNLSRPDVVMVLMEEAISRATAEIESRFAALEKEQGLEPENNEPEIIEEEKKEDDGESIFGLFGLIKRKVMSDEMIVQVN